ncbi:hypothetical protein Hanom_Chr04g00335011 [Helianthus anomalus]
MHAYVYNSCYIMTCLRPTYHNQILTATQPQFLFLTAHICNIQSPNLTDQFRLTGESVSPSSQVDGKKSSPPTLNHPLQLAQSHLAFAHLLAQTPRSLGVVPSTFLVPFG